MSKLITLCGGGYQPARVNFATIGLPSSISVIVSGSKTNPGDKSGKPFSIVITTPGPDGAQTTEPGTAFTAPDPVRGAEVCPDDRGHTCGFGRQYLKTGTRNEAHADATPGEGRRGSGGSACTVAAAASLGRDAATLDPAATAFACRFQRTRRTILTLFLQEILPWTMNARPAGRRAGRRSMRASRATPRSCSPRSPGGSRGRSCRW